MITLDPGHPILKEIVASRLGPSKADARAKEICFLISDFDDATYCVKAQGNSLTVFTKIHAFDTLVKYGVESYLKTIYSTEQFVVDFTSTIQQEITYDFSITVDLAHDFGEEADAVAERVSCVKRNVLAAAFIWYFNEIKSGNPPDGALKIPFRENEAMYLKGKGDTAVVVFSVKFSEKTDWVVAQVFLREFADARNDSTLQQAPAVSYSKSAPMELEGLSVEDGEGVCFISFTLFKRHWDTKLESSLTAICQFRSYLHYHIKCSKAFMHMRMRRKVDDLLAALNRAKPGAEATVEKKTWGGRTLSSR